MSAALRLFFVVLSIAGLAAPAAASLGARGNVTNNGRYAFVYDFANQPVTQTGAVNATYAYDGNLKRVKEVRFLARVFYGEPLRTSPENAWGGKTIYNVYSRLTGSLVYRDEATDAKTTDYVAVVTPRSRISLTASRLNSSLCVLRLPMIASGLSKTPYLGVLQTGDRPIKPDEPALPAEEKHPR